VDPAVNGNPTATNPYGTNPDNPTMTAGSTFVGQFTDHDITFDQTSHLGVTARRSAMNWATPARPSYTLSPGRTAGTHTTCGSTKASASPTRPSEIAASSAPITSAGDLPRPLSAAAEGPAWTGPAAGHR
jgi:hypothetical protein